MKSEYITKDYFDTALRGYTQEIVEHFNKSQGVQNDRIDTLEIELKKDINSLKDDVSNLKGDIGGIYDVLTEYINTDKKVVTLIHELEDDHHLLLPKTSKFIA